MPAQPMTRSEKVAMAAALVLFLAAILWPLVRS